MNNPFLGTGIAIVTPFNDDLSVDYKALENIVEYNITNGINYIVINGTTGESVTITKQEKQDIVAAIIKYNKGRVPLVLGIGGSNTAQVVEEIKATDFTGIAGILSVSPYYSKPTQEGMYQHFKAIAQVCPIDIILYNVPGRTSKNMTPETTLRLAKDFDNIVAVKEAGNNVAQYLELLRDKPDNFSVISGDDDLALGIVLAGGAGVISVIGQGLPKAFSTMINLGLEGKNKEAYQLHFKMMDIVNMIFEENNPAGIKAVLNSLELCNTTVRLPLVTATTQLQSRINTFMTNFSKS
ncbi:MULTISPECIES: 4-hydroxy-tetrahydrodipicolinate synthase [unclassified Olleya]|jgi:4-hydroxy-tetrahydrodipicolinate synthase|uniref:4-hydroxy-tetrahydrodipicolinate synthase n=1 Tax=unclassified Olleya TaxID=2615019 RepID=UPI00119D5C80|nr:4-hydroxy-tetrahydrodipicolinate synthase [Olleya sp. Hel_I_94]TVZ46847.1 4-hydroxy-tetrahydrodipicolinate synthase [Olleya sp. Hel_I_94]|tara:strand:- start:46132 stop:47019 length:888 start_codon:yes stop_codon:yes gene_type:complete